MKRPSTPPPLFEAVRERRFGSATCFLCGRRLGVRTRSDEHIIPLWAQRRYRLGNLRLTLPNGTGIPYRQLTVPCCRDCNGKHLKPLEDQMAAATLAGPSAVAALDSRVLFLWLGKIFYGLLYKELFLALDRAKSPKRSLTDRALLKRFALHHTFLQAARLPMAFEGGQPWTIYVVETQAPDDPGLQWDLRDNMHSMFIACRLGRVGLLAVLQDGGAQALMPHPLGRSKKMPLHPLQYMELCALVCAKSLLFDRTPKYVIGDGTPITVVQMPLMGFSRRPLFRDWDMKLYAQILAFYLEVSLDQVFAPPDKARSWIFGPDKRRRTLLLKDVPWP